MFPGKISRESQWFTATWWTVGFSTCDAAGRGRLGSWPTTPSWPRLAQVADPWEWLPAPFQIDLGKCLFNYLKHINLYINGYYQLLLGDILETLLFNHLEWGRWNTNWYWILLWKPHMHGQVRMNLCWKIEKHLFCMKFQLLPPAWLNQPIPDIQLLSEGGEKSDCFQPEVLLQPLLLSGLHQSLLNCRLYRGIHGSQSTKKRGNLKGYKMHWGSENC